MCERWNKRCIVDVRKVTSHRKEGKKRMIKWKTRQVASLRCDGPCSPRNQFGGTRRPAFSGEKSSGSRSIDFPLKRTDLPHDPARLSAHVTASPIPRLIKCDRPMHFTGDIYISIRSIGMRVFKRPFDLTSLLRSRFTKDVFFSLSFKAVSALSRDGRQ